MKSNRRKFLASSGGCLAAAGLRQMIVPSIAVAQVSGVAPSPVKNIINIFMAGGHDGLQMVLPKSTASFAALAARRPKIMTYQPLDAAGNRLAERPLSVSDLVSGTNEVGLHPAFAESVPGGGLTFAQLMQQGQAKIVHQTGNASNNGSHESATSMYFTGTGTFDAGAPSSRQHWLARLADYHHLASFNVFRLGAAAGPYFERALSALPPVTAPRLSALVLNDRGVDLGGPAESQKSIDALMQMLQAEDRSALPPHGRRLLDSLLATRPAVDQMSAILSETLTGTYGNTHIGVQMADVARVMKYYSRFGSTEPRIFSLNWAGSAPDGSGANFDTHQYQVLTLTDRIRYLNQAISSLHRDTQGALWDATIGVVTAEFGRRVQMNSTEGTDHGWGYVSLLFGGGLNRSGSPVLGDVPAAPFYSNVAADVLPVTTDIRNVMSETLTAAGLSASAAFPTFYGARQLGIVAVAA